MTARIVALMLVLGLLVHAFHFSQERLRLANQEAQLHLEQQEAQSLQYQPSAGDVRRLASEVEKRRQNLRALKTSNAAVQATGRRLYGNKWK